MDHQHTNKHIGTWLGCCLLWMLWASSAVWAQTTLKEYLEPCQVQECNGPNSLICALTADTPFCAPKCDVLTNMCPRGEPCVIQPSGQGACLCKQDDECPAPLKCVQGQCAGTSQEGARCNEQAPCALGMQCVQVGMETETYCRKLCLVTGNNCPSGAPCVNAANSNTPVCLCTQDSECAANSRCLDGRCRPRPSYGDACPNQSACQSNLICALRPGQTEGNCLAACPRGGCTGQEQCVTTSDQKRVCLCNEDNPCPAGIPCIGGACLGQDPRCDNTKSCPSGMQCITLNFNAEGGICRPLCEFSDDCIDGSKCVARQGQRVCFCEDDSDCPAVRTCVLGRCLSAAELEPQPEANPEATPETSVEGNPDPSEVTGDGGTEPSPEPQIEPPTPPCNPPCPGAQRCINNACQKLDFREFCQTNDDCTSGFCFSSDQRAKICSTQDCSQCGLLGLKCLQGNGTEGCYYDPLIGTPPDTSQGGGCNGCQSTSQELSWLLLLCVFLALLRRPRRHNTL